MVFPTMALEMVLSAETYRDVVINDGAEGYWRLDETEGYAQSVLKDAASAYWRMDAANPTDLELDRTGNSRDATYAATAFVSTGQTGATGDSDTAVKFTANGTTGTDTGGYATATVPAFGTSWTLEAWAKRSSLPATGRDLLSIDNLEIYALTGVNGIRVYQAGDKIQGSVAIADSSYHHIVVTCNGVSTKLYVDGAQDGATYAGTINLTTTALSIGRYRGGGYTWDGWIDEVAVFPYALSAQQVANRYALRTSTITTMTVTRFSDETAHGHDGSYSGGVTLQQTALQPDTDKAAKFDGGTGVAQGDAAITGVFSAGLTIEGWYNHNGNAWPSVDEAILNLDNNGTYLSVHNGNLRMGVRTGGTSNTHSAGTMSITGWHHVAASWDSATKVIRLFYDGVAISASAATVGGAVVDTTTAFQIGWSTGLAQPPFNGSLDEVAVYPGALSDAQILAHYLAGTWTDVTTDLMLDQGLKFRYGMAGGGPTDRVADTGWLSFSLNNDPLNSFINLGYYSPLNDNCRTGFGFGIPVRLSFTYLGTTYYKWRGKLTKIDPVPGLARERVTRCYAVDWMDEAAVYAVREVDIQLNKRSDEVFSAVLAAIARQPASTSIQTGRDTYAFALNDIGAGEHPAAATVFFKIAMSELGYIYLKGDTTQGETLVFENRHTRPLLSTNTASLTDSTLIGISVPSTLDNIYNRVEVATHPKRVDASAATVLFSLLSTPTVAAQTSVEIWGDLRDPNIETSLVGGTNMVQPVATTDYVMNTSPDNTGADVTASFTVVAEFFSSSVKFTITNSGMVDGVVTLLQCRGDGIYDYQPEVSITQDLALQRGQGLRVLSIDQPYQSDRNNGQGTADYLFNLYSVMRQQVDSVTFLANDTSTLMTKALSSEISTRIGLHETVTGVTTTVDVGVPPPGWFVNAVEFNVEPTNGGPFLWCTWTLSPSGNALAWILEVSGFSELDTSTVLGFI